MAWHGHTSPRCWPKKSRAALTRCRPRATSAVPAGPPSTSKVRCQRAKGKGQRARRGNASKADRQTDRQTAAERAIEPRWYDTDEQFLLAQQGHRGGQANIHEAIFRSSDAPTRGSAVLPCSLDVLERHELDQQQSRWRQWQKGKRTSAAERLALGAESILAAAEKDHQDRKTKGSARILAQKYIKQRINHQLKNTTV